MSKIIRITSKVPGFRRAGKSHPGHPVDYPAAAIPDHVLAALKAEPNLIVQELDLPDISEPLVLEGSGKPSTAAVDANKEPAGDDAGQGAPGEPSAPEAPDAERDAKDAKAGKAKSAEAGGK
jgi:hypothetical protein